MDSDASSLSDDYDNEYEKEAINTALDDDLDRVLICFGEDALTYREFSSLDLVDIWMHIRTSLPREICEAWGLLPDVPLVIRLSTSLTLYRNADKPSISVYQNVPDALKKQHTSPVSKQLEKILETFISRYWARATDQKSDIMFRDDDLSTLLDMGFEFDDCQKALQQTSNREHAVDKLLNQLQIKKNKDGSDTLPKLQTTQNIANDELLTSIQSSAQQDLDVKRVPPLSNGFLVQVMQYILQRIPTLNEYCVVCDEPHVFLNGAMLKPAVCPRELCVFAFSTLGVMADPSMSIALGAEVIDLLVNLFCQSAISERRELVLDPFPSIVDPTKPEGLALSGEKKDWKTVDKLVKSFPRMSELRCMEEISLRAKLDSIDPLSHPLLKWIINSNRSHIVRLPPDKQLEFMHTSHQFLLLSSPLAKEAKFREAKRQYGSSFAFHGSGIENWHSILRNGLMVASGTAHQVNGAALGVGIYLSPCSVLSMRYSGMDTRFPAQNLVGPVSMPNTAKTGFRGTTLVGRIRPATTAKTTVASTITTTMVPTLSRLASSKYGALYRAGADRWQRQRSFNNCQTKQTQQKRRFLTASNLCCIALCEVINSPESRKDKNTIWVCNNPDHVCTRFLFVYENDELAGQVVTIDGSVNARIRQVAYQYQSSGSRSDES